MTVLTPDITLGALVLEKPGRSKIFEKAGLDYCCRGQQSLAQACADRGIDPEAVLRELAFMDATPCTEDTSWQANLDAARTHILETHHAYTKEALPRLLQLTAKVAKVHGDENPRLVELYGRFKLFAQETFDHLAKEEQILFPMIEKVARGERPTMPPTVQFPISVMLQEHLAHGENLEAFRALTDGYVPPAHACGSWRAMLAGLEELEQDLHRHIHKENSYLFPKAIEAEQKL
jgi:regulator of cell morphogenesis and NO signaling